MLIPDSDGLDWKSRTARMTAYERSIESFREDRLFNDPYAELFAGDGGKSLSDFISKGFDK